MAPDEAGWERAGRRCSPDEKGRPSKAEQLWRWREGLEQGEWAAALVMASLWGGQLDGKEKTPSWVTPRLWLISGMEDGAIL